MKKCHTHPKFMRGVRATFALAVPALFLSSGAAIAALEMQPSAIEEPIGKDAVRVVGQVRKPGIYTVGAHTTVYDVVSQANGFTGVAKKAAIAPATNHSAITVRIATIRFNIITSCPRVGFRVGLRPIRATRLANSRIPRSANRSPRSARKVRCGSCGQSDPRQ